MTAALRPTTATAGSKEGNQAVYGVTRERNAVDLRVQNSSSVSSTDKQSRDFADNNASLDVGPAFSVEISPEGKALSQNGALAQAEDTGKKQVSLAESKQKTQKEWRIQREVVRLQQTDSNIRAHEQAHMSAGGAFAGVASFIYSKGPDGRMYVSGGEVPIQAPEGKTPEETIGNMEIVRRAALAPPDPSGQDLAVAAAAMQIESRARAAIRQGRFLKQSDMENGNAYSSAALAVIPTSMAGLIATLMPQEGMLG